MNSNRDDDRVLAWSNEHTPDSQDKIVIFPDPQQLSLSVSASALIFSDDKSKQLLSLKEKVAPSNATALVKAETSAENELEKFQYYLLNSII